LSLLLDTDVCIALLRGKLAGPRRRVAASVTEGRALHVSAISLHELWFGVAGSDRSQAGAAELARLATVLKVLDFDAEDARAAGQIRCDLKRRGTPIGPFDALIAGQAFARGLILATGNHREFSRVDGLRLESWLD
jgi:tRNA(fMet)-specific endonuclease VapC